MSPNTAVQRALSSEVVPHERRDLSPELRKHEDFWSLVAQIKQFQARYGSRDLHRAIVEAER